MVHESEDVFASASAQVASEPVPEAVNAFLSTGTEAWNVLRKCSDPRGLDGDVMVTCNSAVQVVQPTICDAEYSVEAGVNSHEHV
jgi:hypothetical protein